MAWEITAELRRFREAIAWFRQRVPVTKEEWDRIESRARRRAFMVSDAHRLSTVSETWRSLDAALTRGLTFAQWKKTTAAALLKAWGGTVKNPGWRLETIWRTNTQSAYAAGRWRQLTHPSVLRMRPFWLYDAVLDSRTTALCSELDGTLLPADDPWWDTHHPPVHYNCRSAVRSQRRRQAERRGGPTGQPPTTAAQTGFGYQPSAAEWRPTEDEYPPQLWDAYVSRVGDRVHRQVGGPQWGTAPAEGDGPPWHMGERQDGGELRNPDGLSSIDELVRGAYLARDGNKVVVPGPDEETQQGRRWDFNVNGLPVEAKRPLAGGLGADVRRRAATSVRRSLDGGGQAPVIIVDVRGSAMGQSDARELAHQLRGAEGLDYLRVVGDDFDLTFDLR